MTVARRGTPLRECAEIIKNDAHRGYRVHIFHHASESGSGTEETGRYDLVRKYLCSVLNVLSKE